MIDLIFPVVQGETFPADHGYGLYSALCHWNPAIKDMHWQLGTIPGIPDRHGCITLADKSRLTIRTDEDHVDDFLELAWQQLTVGNHSLLLGSADLSLPEPNAVLSARLVTIKQQDHHCGKPEPFRDAVLLQMGRLGISGSVTVGDRKTIKIQRFSVVGFAVEIINLSDRSSLLLQANGLGGKRRMGCGVFMPPVRVSHHVA